MKKTMVLISTMLLGASAFAATAKDSSRYQVKGKDASRLITALEAAKVRAEGSEDSLFLSTRAIVCDTNPKSQSACTIVTTKELAKPIYVTGKVALNVLNALSAAVASADPNEPQCDSGMCSAQFTMVACEGHVNGDVACDIQ